MARYVVTPLGPWKTDTSGREPQVAEMYEVTREGERVRPVIARAPYVSLSALRRHLVAAGVEAETAETRAREVFRVMGYDATVELARTGNLRHALPENPDAALPLPVELDTNRARHRAAAADLSAHVGRPFDVDD